MSLPSPPLPDTCPPIVREFLDALRANPALAREVRRELAVGDEDTLLSAAEMAPRFGKSPKTIERWCRAGRIPSARKIGRTWFMDADAMVLPYERPSLGDPGAPGRRGGRTPAAHDDAGREAIASLRARARTPKPTRARKAVA